MNRRFKIIETNLENITDSHFECNTVIGKKNNLLNSTLRTVMFDGIYVELRGFKGYIKGEVHGIQPE
jgi:hypothetical protein